MLHSPLVLDDHDQINAFDADLQSPAAAGDGKERRRAPAVCGPAGGNASAILRAKDKAALDHVRHHGHALCVLQNFFRNALIRRGHDLVQHRAGMIQPVNRCFAIGSRPADARQTEYCH
jgi:hypothetical protein